MAFSWEDWEWSDEEDEIEFVADFVWCHDCQETTPMQRVTECFEHMVELGGEMIPCVVLCCPTCTANRRAV